MKHEKETYHHTLNNWMYYYLHDFTIFGNESNAANHTSNSSHGFSFFHSRRIINPRR